jgi:hypothetical protein
MSGSTPVARCSPLAALRLAFPASLPDAGSILQLKPVLTSCGATGLAIAPEAGAQRPSSAPFPVPVSWCRSPGAGLLISGNTLFGSAAVLERSLTLPGIDALSPSPLITVRGYL